MKTINLTNHPFIGREFKTGNNTVKVTKAEMIIRDDSFREDRYSLGIHLSMDTTWSANNKSAVSNLFDSSASVEQRKDYWAFRSVRKDKIDNLTDEQVEQYGNSLAPITVTANAPIADARFIADVQRNGLETAIERQEYTSPNGTTVYTRSYIVNVKNPDASLTDYFTTNNKSTFKRSDLNKVAHLKYQIADNSAMLYHGKVLESQEVTTNQVDSIFS